MSEKDFCPGGDYAGCPRRGTKGAPKGKCERCGFDFDQEHLTPASVEAAREAARAEIPRKEKVRAELLRKQGQVETTASGTPDVRKPSSGEPRPGFSGDASSDDVGNPDDSVVMVAKTRDQIEKAERKAKNETDWSRCATDWFELGEYDDFVRCVNRTWRFYDRSNAPEDHVVGIAAICLAKPANEHSTRGLEWFMRQLLKLELECDDATKFLRLAEACGEVADKCSDNNFLEFAKAFYPRIINKTEAVASSFFDVYQCAKSWGNSALVDYEEQQVAIRRCMTKAEGLAGDSVSNWLYCAEYWVSSDEDRLRCQEEALRLAAVADRFSDWEKCAKHLRTYFCGCGDDYALERRRRLETCVVAMEAQLIKTSAMESSEKVDGFIECAKNYSYLNRLRSDGVSDGAAFRCMGYAEGLAKSEVSPLFFVAIGWSRIGCVDDATRIAHSREKSLKYKEDWENQSFLWKEIGNEDEAVKAENAAALAKSESIVGIVIRKVVKRLSGQP